MFIVGHMEIGDGVCRTDLMMIDKSIAIEYPCEYYSELKDLDKKLQNW
jgi:hypothetical protein